MELTKGTEQKTDRTAEKNLPRRNETPNDTEDQRLKKILKSMKPIEKRKDGTLVDYGVTVPSRKPPGKFRQSSAIQSKTPIQIDENKVVTLSTTDLKNEPVQIKILEPQKIPVKKQTPTEPKSVSSQVKIVEAEKISSVKKKTSTESKTVPIQEKIVEAEKVLSVKKEVFTEPKKMPTREKIVEAEKVSSQKKQTPMEPKGIPVVRIVDIETIHAPKKPMETKNSEIKKLKEPVLTTEPEKYSSNKKDRSSKTAA